MSHSVDASASSQARQLPVPPQAETLARIDRSLMALRQVLVRPVTAELPVPSLGRSVDFAKVMACEAAAMLASADAPLTVKSLSAALHLDHSTMSRVLADAEANGLLVRGSDPADRRRTTVELTEDGRSLVADGIAMRTWFMGQLLDDWTTEDVDTLARLLERAVGTFDERLPLVRDEAEALLGMTIPLE